MNIDQDKIDSLITTIKLENYHDLFECFKSQLHNFKFDMGNLISLLDPSDYYRVSISMRELKDRIELLIKLSDFIDYVSVLQDSIKELD